MKVRAFVLSIVALTASACVCGGSPSLIDIWDPNSQPPFSDHVGRCPLPPESLQESDLVGTWTARYAHGIDTLILEEDSTYRQIYAGLETGDYYESDWQEWWVEYRESGVFYLHLKGMLKCDGIGGGCQQADDADWFDFCERRYVTMHGEVILLVIGVPANRVEPPHAVELWQLSPNVDTFPKPFLFQP